MKKSSNSDYFIVFHRFSYINRAKLHKNKGVATQNTHSVATPFALKQQAYERFRVSPYHQPLSSWSEQWPQSHSLSNSRSCQESLLELLLKLPNELSEVLFSFFLETSLSSASPNKISKKPISIRLSVNYFSISSVLLNSSKSARQYTFAKSTAVTSKTQTSNKRYNHQ